MPGCVPPKGRRTKAGIGCHTFSARLATGYLQRMERIRVHWHQLLIFCRHWLGFANCNWHRLKRKAWKFLILRQCSRGKKCNRWIIDCILCSFRRKTIHRRKPCDWPASRLAAGVRKRTLEFEGRPWPKTNILEKSQTKAAEIAAHAKWYAGLEAIFKRMNPIWVGSELENPVHLNAMVWHTGGTQAISIGINRQFAVACNQVILVDRRS